MGRSKLWTTDDVWKLRKLASETTMEAAARVLGRSVSAVRMKAMKHGISFRKAQSAAMRAYK